MDEEIKVPTVEINWHEYKLDCFERQFYPGTIFRGQSNSNWQLIPSFARFKGAPNINEYFSNILPKIKRYISGYVEHDFDLEKDGDRNRLLGLLQHHGFPTPLLDWTNSPYFAAYFAFIDSAFQESSCDHVAIWRLNAEFAIKFIKEKEGKAPFDILMPDARFNMRLLSQDGLFTLSLSSLPLDEELSKLIAKYDHPGLLQKYLLPAHFSHLALKDLNLMGIHAGTLFAGIDGTCSMLKNQFFMESEIVQTPKKKRIMKMGLDNISKLQESTEDNNTK